MAELFIKTDFVWVRYLSKSRTKPESGWSAEVGIKQGLKYFNWMGFVDIWILMEYDDMMEFSFGFWGSPTKHGRIRF